MTGVERLGVVVPARDEQARLGPCLAALDAAARTAGLPLEVVVVLDACRDASEQVARSVPLSSSRLHLLTVGARNVGTARRAGIDVLQRALGDGEGGWWATTDADSRVPPDWFVRQLAHRAAGAAMVVGTVRVDDWEGLPELRSPWQRRYSDARHAHGASPAHAPGRGHDHVHGANLAFTASSYRRVGGFRELTTGEDVGLVRAFRAAGEAVVWATDLPVCTSPRLRGRAPRGFASYLRAMGSSYDAAPTPLALP